MRAAWYERQGPAWEVLTIGEMPDVVPGAGEVRIRVATSGINPGDVKKRQDTFGVGMPYPRVIPHSDGAGTIDHVGEGVPATRIGERVWCYGAQSYRPFGTAAEFVVVPAEQAVPLAEDVTFEQGACLGIPGITGFQAVNVGGSVAGGYVLVQGGAGAVGLSAVALARHTGARVIATVRSEPDEHVARRAGAHHVLRTDGCSVDETAEAILAMALNGVQHIVEVAFDANIDLDTRVLAQGGSIAAYATRQPEPAIPFWPLLFKNARLYLLGSDDFPADVKQTAARELNAALSSGWSGFEIRESYPLEAIAEAHIAVEKPVGAGRVVLTMA